MGKSAAGHLRVRTDKAAAELDMDFWGSSCKPDYTPRAGCRVCHSQPLKMPEQNRNQHSVICWR
jgi:hypothetical protein